FESQMRAYVISRRLLGREPHVRQSRKDDAAPTGPGASPRARGGIDLMANENFLATCRFFIPLLSPPEPLTRNHRRVPAIGDHHFGKHDDFGCVFGWLATLCPAHRDEFLWAWREEGSSAGEPRCMQTTTFSPLLLPERDAAFP